MNKRMLGRVTFSLLFVLIIKGCLFAQTTFNKTYDFSNGLEQVYGVCPIDDGYILLGSGYGNEFGDFFDIKMKLAKIDLEGNVVWQRVYGAIDTNLFIYPKNGIVVMDGGVVVCGSRQTVSTSQIHLIKFNPTTGDTIFYKVFNFDDEIYGLQVQELSDGSLIILGYDSNDSFAFFFFKTTFDGQFVWNKRYGTISEGYPTDFNVLNDTLYVINGNYLCSPEGYRIRTIDSAGNVISTDFYDDDCVTYGLKSMFDGYIGAGAYYPIPPYQTFGYKTDANGNIIWHYETSIDIDTLDYEQLFPDILKELSNGDIIVSGYYSSNYLGSYVTLISKVNSAGVAYWQRQYTSTLDKSDDNIPYDIEVCTDGGYIIAGSAFGESEIESQNFWALKLDSMGCLIPGCDTLGVGIVNFIAAKSRVQIFPNPLTNYSEVKISLNNQYSMGAYKYTLMDVTGKVIMSADITEQLKYMSHNIISFTLERGSIPEGIYIFSIYESNIFIGGAKLVVVSI